MTAKIDPSQIRPTEAKCLALVSFGLESKHIAPLVGMTPGSVDSALKRAAERTGVRGRKHLAVLFRRDHPDLIQSLLQQLGQSEKSLAAISLAEPAESAADPQGGRPWGDLPAWQKRLWAAVIAIGMLFVALLSVKLGSHVLVSTPRPQHLGLGDADDGLGTADRGSDPPAAARIRAQH